MASLDVQGSSKIKGAVIANDIKVIGDGIITYDDSFSTAFFDQLEWPGTTDDDTDDDTPPPVNNITSYGTWLKDI